MEFLKLEKRTDVYFQLVITQSNSKIFFYDFSQASIWATAQMIFPNLNALRIWMQLELYAILRHHNYSNKHGLKLKPTV